MIAVRYLLSQALASCWHSEPSIEPARRFALNVFREIAHHAGRIGQRLTDARASLSQPTNLIAVGNRSERDVARVPKAITWIILIGLLAACSKAPSTDHELTRQAERAVDDELGAQGQFSLMQAVASQKIACGHVTAADVPGHGEIDQDFVYQDGRLIMDDDHVYETAAIACDRAAGGEKSVPAQNGGGA